MAREYYADLVDKIEVTPGETIKIHSPAVPVLPQYLMVEAFIETSNDIEVVLENSLIEQTEGSRTRDFILRIDTDFEKANVRIGARDMFTNEIIPEKTKDIVLTKVPEPHGA